MKLITYSKTNWLEHTPNTAAKLTALDNLEGMYGEAVSYIDSITHSSRYYTEAECNAKYFTSSTDGSGSGLICATLDGLTADQIIAAGVPSGSIAIWSGSEASIPSGWYLCNGSNGTPNLRNRFVVAAGGNYAKGATGGANTITTAATVTIAGHSLTAGEIPKHTHTGIVDYYAGSWITEGTGYTYSVAGSQHDVSRTTGSTGSGDAHSHSATWDGTDDQVKMPLYYALCWIMKS